MKVLVIRKVKGGEEVGRRNPNDTGLQEYLRLLTKAHGRLSMKLEEDEDFVDFLGPRKK